MKYNLIIPQNIMKVITIWDRLAGISGLLGGGGLLWGGRLCGGSEHHT